MTTLQDGFFTGWKPSAYCDRGTLDLICGCGFTIYLCCWAAMHMNVPADDDTVAGRTRRKIKHTILFLIVPEFVTLVALDELLQSRGALAEFADIPALRTWTLTHAFLLRMGAISLTTPSGEDFRPSIQHFLNLARSGQVTIPELSKDEIEDRSKADWMVKTLAIVQVSWFALGLLGRAVRHLPVTTLELFTVIIIFYTVATYVCWWHKPKDVNRPFRFATSVSFEKLSCSLESELYRCFRAPGKRVALDDMNLVNPMNPRPMTQVWGSFLLVTSWLGPLHALAWNYHFPTEVERLIWRIAAIVCSVLPCVSLPIVHPWGQKRLGGLGTKITGFAFTTCLAVYVLLRWYLLTESLVSIRSVPVGVYEVVRWSSVRPGSGG